MDNNTPKNNNLQTLVDGVKEQSRKMLEEKINFLLATELTVELDYEKYERHGWQVVNSRNGYYFKTIMTEYGKITVKVPRDRMSEFKIKLFEKYQSRTDSLEQMIITLYTKGITTREIATLIEKMYGEHYSPATISNITDAVNENIIKYHNRTITEHYDVIYIDATHISIKRDNYYSKEAVYVLLGVTSNGNKEIINYYINPTESATNWDVIFKDLIDKGLKKPKLFVTDALTGIFDVIERNFDQPKIQTCLVHVVRNLMKMVKIKERTEIAKDFMEVRKAKDKESAFEILDLFVEKWGSNSKYKRTCDNLLNNRYLLTIFDVPENIRSSVYSTNVIESFNKIIKTGIKKKSSFPTVDSLDKYLYLNVSEYNFKNSTRVHKGFKHLEW